MTNFNPCSSCRFRHDNKNLNQIYACCYNACARFGNGVVSDVCRSKCRKCSGGGILDQKPKIVSKEGFFWDCLNVKKNSSKDSSLDCCLEKCKDDYECQEHCIDDYNSTIPVTKVINPYKMFLLIFLIFIIFRMKN